MMKDCKIIYINLDKRKDRKDHIEKQLKDLNLNNFERFPAVKKKVGWHGNVLSFCSILEKAISENYEQLLIVEDDMLITDIDKFNESINSFEKNVGKNFDVLLLGGNNIGPLKEHTEFYCKITHTYAGTGYLINKHYYKTYLDRLLLSKNHILNHPGQNYHWIYASDAITQELQTNDNWYFIFPYGAIQLPGFSDIVGKKVDYTPYMTSIVPVSGIL